MKSCAIVATVVDDDNVTGVERYVIELVRHLDTQYVKIVVLCHPRGVSFFRGISDRLDIYVSPFHSKIFTDQLWLPWITRYLKVAVIYNASLAYPYVGFGSIPFIMMVHDATPWRFPETTSRGMKLYYRPLLDRALASNSLLGVITNSQCSKQDICAYTGYIAEKIWPVHLGVNHRLFNVGGGIRLSPKSSDSKYGQYILTVGTLEPRKNLQIAIDAFSILAKKWNEVSLIVVGRKGWLQSLDIPSELRGRIHFTGYVTDEALVELYRKTDCFLITSLYEGFGFPLVEAMCCGAPVVASRIASLVEIGSNACLFADPTSADEFAKQIDAVLSEPDMRISLSQAVLERARQFNWKETANKTWSIIESITLENNAVQ